MTDRIELQRLMTAAADGDRPAVDLLFRALWSPLVGYATRFIGDPALAEDCVQDAIVKLFGQLDRYDRDRDALTWALTHVTWQCRTARRQRQRRAEASVPSGDLRSSRDPSATGGSIDGVALAEERDLVRAALSALDTLGARDREIIFGALTDDTELRRALAPSTFRKRFERAVARLRTSWRSRHGTL